MLYYIPLVCQSLDTDGMLNSNQVESVRARKTRKTRQSLCRHASAVFAEKGYSEASIDEIVQRAGVTKGALYHHFPDKLQLYRSVVQDMAQGLVSTIEAAAESQPDPWHRLEAMCNAYLDACQNSDVQRVLVVDAPVVLGWKSWCDINNDTSTGALASCLRDAMAAGQIDEQSSENLAQLISGSLNVAARVIVESPRISEARTTVSHSMERLLSGLRRKQD